MCWLLVVDCVGCVLLAVVVVCCLVLLPSGAVRCGLLLCDVSCVFVFWWLLVVVGGCVLNCY